MYRGERFQQGGRRGRSSVRSIAALAVIVRPDRSRQGAFF